jgi:hypothetical protein
MKKVIVLFLGLTLLCSFYQTKSLKGTWEYAGDVFNGKKQGPPTEYTLERKYNNDHYDAFLLEKGSKPGKYETGNYTLTADSCTETQTWTNQDPGLLNIPVHYHYLISNDTLILTGVLPNGHSVEEYWKRIK